VRSRGHENFLAPDAGSASAALRDAEQALKLDPELPLAHTARAVVFHSSQGGWKFADAVHEHRKAIAISPGSEWPHQELSRLLWHQGWFRETREEREQVRRLNPLSVDLAAVNANLLVFEGRPHEALEKFRQLPPLGGAYQVYTQWLTNLARVQIGDPTLTLEELEAWGRERPRDELALSVVAIARAKAGAPGVADLEQRILALDQAGHFHHALHGLAGARAQLGDTAGAIAYLRRASETGLPCLPCFDADPLLEPVRGTPEYAGLRADLLREEEQVRARLKALEESDPARTP
jgi:tetratricopeptide (TPR) repeat protein